jgi:hypothetical protein
MYVVLNKPERRVPFGDLVGTTECVTLLERKTFLITDLIPRGPCITGYASFHN